VVLAEKRELERIKKGGGGTKKGKLASRRGGWGVEGIRRTRWTVVHGVDEQQYRWVEKKIGVQRPSSGFAIVSREKGNAHRGGERGRG